MEASRNAVSELNHRHNRWQMDADLRKRGRNKSGEVVIVAESGRNSSGSLSQ